MATYTGTMYVGGEVYSSTAGGYQIAGDDAATANATCTLPDTYTSYESCSISCTFYSATAPSGWRSDWGCFLGVYKNDNLYGADTQWIDKRYFSDGNGASSRSFSCTLTGGHFEPGDTITIAFIGSDGGYVDSSNRCVYLTSASFTSDDAVKEYTLYFSANGGSGAPGSRTGEADSSGYATITIPSTVPTRSGFTFLGWARSSSGSVAYEAGDEIEINKDTTLYAVWKQVTYSVTYDDNGADSGTAPTDGTAYSSGATVAVAGPGSMAKEGYAFAGWNTAADGSGITYTQGATFTITSAVTLYAIWVEENKAYIFDGTAWQTAKPYIYDGTTWQAAKMCLFTTEWNS